MNGYKITSLLALLALVVAIPIYVLSEPGRLAQAQVVLRQEFVSDAALMYVENCAVCHGAAGEGIGPVPALDNPALWTADYDFLFKTIARGRYNTTMAGWHVDEGGIFNDYQVDELIALIRYVDWSQVGELAAVRGLIPPTLPVPQVDDDFLAQIAALDPQGSQWAEGIHLFANNCTVCHGVNGEGSDLGVPLNTDDLRAQEAVELARIITEGVPGTAMVSWQNTLSVDDIAALVAFLKNWDVIEAQGLALEPPEPIRIDLNNPEEVLALGERIYSTTCIACHGENGSGGTGPALNSLQVLTNSSDAQLESTIVNGGRRPNSTMPAFGDRLTSVEIGALVDFIRAWEPTATWVENPRGTAQGGGPPWLRTTPDGNNTVSPGGAAGSGAQGGGQGSGQGGGQGGPPWRQSNTDTTGTAAPQTEQASQGPTVQFSGQVVIVEGNLLTFRDAADGVQVEAMLGPPWFWSESGIPLNPGDQIELEGFESTDHMEVNWLANQTTGQRIELRTAEGQPVWTGG
jgi:mono/diheme cytochrome c family protein